MAKAFQINLILLYWELVILCYYSQQVKLIKYFTTKIMSNFINNFKGLGVITLIGS